MAIFNNVKKFMCANSNHILAGSAIVGLGATVYLAVKETPSFQKAVEKAETKMEKIKVGLKAYYPAIISGTITIGCIVGLDVSSLKKLEAATEALKTLKKSTEFISEEKEAFESKLEEKDPRLAEEIRKDKSANLNKMPQPIKLFCFRFGDREIWFEDSEHNVLLGKYSFWRTIREDGYANMNDLLRQWDCESFGTDGDMYGFNKRGKEWDLPDFPDFIDREKTTKDGRQYTLITFADLPYVNYTDPDMDTMFREEPELSVLDADVPPWK